MTDSPINIKRYMQHMHICFLFFMLNLLHFSSMSLVIIVDAFVDVLCHYFLMQVIYLSNHGFTCASTYILCGISFTQVTQGPWSC